MCFVNKRLRRGWACWRVENVTENTAESKTCGTEKSQCWGNVQTDMTGPNAMITPLESITGMRAVIDGLDMSKTGTFWRYNGEAMPW